HHEGVKGGRGAQDRLSWVVDQAEALREVAGVPIRDERVVDGQRPDVKTDGEGAERRQQWNQRGPDGSRPPRVAVLAGVSPVPTAGNAIAVQRRRGPGGGARSDGRRAGHACWSSETRADWASWRRPARPSASAPSATNQPTAGEADGLIGRPGRMAT